MTTTVWSPALISTGANLSGADARGANFELAALTNANLSHANLTNSNLYEAALSGANLASVGARGAHGLYFDLASTITANLIRENGPIYGLDVNADQLLVVRDYDGDSRYEPAPPPIPITVDQQLTIGPGDTLRIMLEADAGDSTISFAPGISVVRNGTLELTFAPDVNLASQLGRTIDLFDWSGVTPTGTFTVSSAYTRNLANLYTTSELTPRRRAGSRSWRF